jgi:predicted negative regulator of RcsB-dependent stress response
MYDLEEQEQIDALKAWWGQYGRTVMVAALAAVLAAGATLGWREYRQSQAEKASALFGALEQASRAGDQKQVRELSAQVMDKYGSSAYGAMAALVAAKVNFEAGDLKSASAQLQWASEHARDDETQAVARLRLAGVRLDEKQYDDALKLLEQPHPESFAGLYADMRGDILVGQGKLAEAKAAYKLALDKLPPEGNYRILVQVKLDGIGGAN